MTASPPTPLTNRLRAQGEFNSAWDTIADMDPAWLESFLAMGLKPRFAGALDPKTWELIAIAVDASCTHLYAPGVRRHIRKALELGARPEEIMAVLEGVAVLGIHSCALGFPILAEEMAAARAAAE
ncbi:carboxymuconolactone decarboxylase family protein [Phenylobacterium montanum]|uniref:Carboxymuconolactone decarboxylase family protein n=1 Tax=Phenylobacterium montanum TaxID=2823693 RepID=A0A975IV25_9CAUL|nr:carboxymuconolactone decarboxylase family protein [Caulobacter sp. S6]QUD88350.1 carboxymuconolactone decarboxylase family protein [Caulobacter sp. S6]